MSEAKAIELLNNARAELAELSRARHYMFWRADTAGPLGQALLETTPFEPLADLEIITGDGKGPIAASRIGDWAIDQLVAKVAPEAALAHLAEELQRNRTTYTEVRIIAGVAIDAPCILSPTLQVAPTKDLLSMLRGDDTKSGPAEVRQSFTVAPAFITRDLPMSPAAGLLTPSAQQRAEELPILRYACLLASSGPVEFAAPVTEPDRTDLFVAPKTNDTMTYRPLGKSASRIEAGDLKAIVEKLTAFRRREPLHRAIERLGRARRTKDSVDRALELGIAAEIAMTHADNGTSEIAYRLSTRMAWLLGQTPEDRELVFNEAKALYQARSMAVHQGRLGPKAQPDLAAGDRLVTRALREIVARGAFPDWNKLTMGIG